MQALKRDTTKQLICQTKTTIRQESKHDNIAPIEKKEIIKGTESISCELLVKNASFLITLGSI